MVKPKTESTAVNELINLVASGGPSAPAPADDLFREPAFAAPPRAMPRKRAPHGTQPPTARGSGPSVAPSASTPPRMSTSAATPPPVPTSSRASIVPPPIPTASRASIVPPPEPAKIDMTDQSWFHDTRATGRIQPPAGEHWIGTMAIARQRPPRGLVRMMIGPALAAAAIGVAIGAYFVMTAKHDAVAAAMPAAMPAEAAPSAQPTTAPSAPPIAAPVALVDVRIDSKPAGATVTLIDDGKEMFVGTTPIVTSVDPARTYEVVLARGDLEQTEHLDPRATSHLDIALAAESKPELAKRETRHEHAKHEAKAQKVAMAEVPAAPKPAKIAKAAKAAPAGVLMIASKPPCQIYVDGKATGLMTPQRAISVAAGTHKVTLVSLDRTYKKTVAVDVSAGKPTKVIQDLMGAGQ